MFSTMCAALPSSHSSSPSRMLLPHTGGLSEVPEVPDELADPLVLPVLPVPEVIAAESELEAPLVELELLDDELLSPSDMLLTVPSVSLELPVPSDTELVPEVDDDGKCFMPSA